MLESPKISVCLTWKHYAQLLTQVAWWTSFEEKYKGELDAEASVFGGESGKKRRDDLRLRVIEHNILVISTYYSRITVARLAQLLDLPSAEVSWSFCPAWLAVAQSGMSSEHACSVHAKALCACCAPAEHNDHVCITWQEVFCTPRWRCTCWTT